MKKNQPNLFELLCKLVVIQPTSVPCEQSFSHVKRSISIAPQLTIQTLMYRVCTKFGLRKKSLKEILFTWFPIEEQVKVKSTQI